MVYRRGWYPTAYLRTWFLDDVGNLLEWQRWREFELDPRIALWEPRLRELWTDQLIGGAPLDIQFVSPPVAPIPGWTAHLGDLILVQRPQIASCAILVRTQVRFSHEDRLGLLALLVSRRQSRIDLLRRVRLTFQCWQHPCTIHRGSRLLLDGVFDHQPFSGLSIVADMGPDLPVPAEAPGLDELSLMQIPPISAAPSSSGLSQAVRTPWESVIFDLWITQGATACDEIGPELFVETWYIHHDDHRICWEPRIWIAIAPMASWEAQLKELWHDVFDPMVPFGVFVAETDVPVPRCHARLLLVQGTGPYRAVLLSALYADHPGHQLVQAAFSSPTRVDGYYLQRLLGTVGPCQHVDCELWHHGHRLEFGSSFDLWDGWTAELHVPFDPPPRDEVSLMAMGRFESRPPEPFLMDDPRLVHDGEFDEEDTTEEDSSDEDSPWRLSAIFSTQLAPVFGRTDWTSYDDLKQSARDLFSPDADDLVAVHHVPHPPGDLEDDGFAAFIGELPEDQDDSGIVNALILLDVGFFRNRPDDAGDVSIRLAKAVPPLLTRDGLLDLVGVQPYCAALQLPLPGPGCLLWRNDELVRTQDDGALHFVHGDYVRIALPPSPVLPLDFSVRRAAGLCYRGHALEDVAARVETATLSNDSAEDLLPLGDPLPPAETDDDPSLMQLPASSLTPVGPDLASASHSTSAIRSSWFDTLHSLWRDVYFGPGCAGPTEEGALALTWYLDHEHAPFTTQSRVLSLRPTPGTWLVDLQRLWIDRVDPWVPCDVVVVRPPPFAAPSEHFVHLILVQRARPTLASTLVALVDDLVDPWTSEISAVAVPLQLSHRGLLHHLNLVPPCPPLGLAWRCETFGPDGQLFDEGRDVDLFSGATLMVSIYRSPPAPVPSAASPDFVGLLQLGARRISSLLDQVDEPLEQHTIPLALEAHLPHPPEAHYTLDCHQAFQSFACLQEAFLVPSFEVDELLGWHPVAHWIHSWWDGHTPFEELAIYFDGAFLAGPASAGLGVAAFVRVGQSWFFAGFLAATLPEGFDSYQAEQTAGATAAKLAFDLLSVRAAATTAPVLVGLYYDSITVGTQAQSRWATKRHIRAGKVLRSLIRLCQAAYPCEFLFAHVRGHSGEPGNEMADYLASAAANHWDPFCLDLTLWLHLLQDAAFVGGLEWTWTLFHHDFLPLWQGHRLVLPPVQWQPIDADCLHCPAPTSSSATSLWTLRLVSYNALSAAGAVDRATSSSSPSRLDMLVRQMADLKVHIFALQETRIRHVLPSELADYHIYQSPADHRGHFGVVIGLSKTLPLDANNRHCLHPSAVKIIHQSPRILILGLTLPGFRCILFGLHAPHSGESDAALHTWWRDVAEAVPPRYRDWPAVVLADANAVVGAQPTQHIGDYQPGPLEAKAVLLWTLSRLPTFFCLPPLSLGNVAKVRPGPTLRGGPDVLTMLVCLFSGLINRALLGCWMILRLGTTIPIMCPCWWRLQWPCRTRKLLPSRPTRNFHVLPMMVLTRLPLPLCPPSLGMWMCTTMQPFSSRLLSEFSKLTCAPAHLHPDLARPRFLLTLGLWYVRSELFVNPSMS